MPKTYTEKQTLIHKKLGLDNSTYFDANLERQDILLAMIARIEVIEKHCWNKKPVT